MCIGWEIAHIHSNFCKQLFCRGLSHAGNLCYLCYSVGKWLHSAVNFFFQGFDFLLKIIYTDPYSLKHELVMLRKSAFHCFKNLLLAMLQVTIGTKTGQIGSICISFQYLIDNLCTGFACYITEDTGKFKISVL